MTTNWYALHVKPHKERAVQQLLHTQEIEVYLPTIKVKPKNPRAAKQKPYFPGYMFVHADLEELGANAFTWTPGTHGLVSFGDEPAVVPDSLISELRTFMQHVTQMQEKREEFQRGDRVRIIDGPFTGYEAIFDMYLPGKDRVQVLLAFLSNQHRPMKIDKSDIKKIGDN